MLATVFHIGLLDAGYDHFWQKLADIFCNVLPYSHNSHGQIRIFLQQGIQVGFAILQGLFCGKRYSANRLRAGLVSLS
jgi:hypothetical protein